MCHPEFHSLDLPLRCGGHAPADEARRATTSDNVGGSGTNKWCLCSPTDHPGSFRCRFHKHDWDRWKWSEATEGRAYEACNGEVTISSLHVSKAIVISQPCIHKLTTFVCFPPCNVLPFVRSKEPGASGFRFYIRRSKRWHGCSCLFSPNWAWNFGLSIILAIHCNYKD